MQYTPLEFVVYNLLRSGVLVAFAYPFLRDKGRFSQRVTAFFFILLEVLWLVIAALGQMDVFQTMGFAAKIEIVQTAMMVIILLIAIKEKPGKLLFIFFILYTLGSFLSVFAKYIEICWNKEIAYQGYRWSASVSILITLALVFTPVIFLIHRDFRAVMGKSGDSTMWRYIWLIPGAFYLFWLQSFYLSEGSTLDYASNIWNIVFMLSIEASALFIYHMIVRLVIEHDSLMQERALRHTLQMQIMEYDDLNKRISDARKTRHDLRHHVAVLESFIDNPDPEGLRNYINEFRTVHRLTEPIIYCENRTANAVLTYFAQIAAEQETAYKVDFFLPEDVKIDSCDISVLLGNIVENALEACAKLPSGTASVSITGGMLNAGTFAFDVENSCLASATQILNGRFQSTKHEGNGIGTISVRDIAERYNGMVNFESEGDSFRTSVVMYIK